MEKILPNLYRFSLGPIGKKGTFHTYLLVRKQGNILICHSNRGSTVLDHLDEIERLGGIDRQFVAHYHDAKRGDLHQVLYDRFGCKLSYHEAERKTIRTKTKCPEEEFGNDGLKLGSDFEAIYFPGHTVGMSIFRWKHRGKYHLFPSHVIRQGGGRWSINLDPAPNKNLQAQFKELPNLQVDFSFPGSTDGIGEEFHRCTDATRTSFRKAMKDRLKPRKKVVKKVPAKRLLSSALPTTVTDAITAANFTCGNLPDPPSTKGVDVIYFQNDDRTLGQEELQSLRQFVENGGGLMVAESRPKAKARSIATAHPFPEVATHLKGKKTGGKMIVSRPHTALMMKKWEPIQSPGYSGSVFEPGPKGKPLVVNEAGDPVLVYARIKKGRVLFSSIAFDSKLHDSARHLIQNNVLWLASVQ